MVAPEEEPRGFEPPPSAVQTRCNRFLELSQPCKIPAKEPILEKTLCSGFQVINPGCCTRVRLAFEVLANVLHFTCKSRDFGGGRCWDRTSVLCRVKAGPSRRGCSLVC